MPLDYTVKVTDLVMIVALVVGPIAAVQITEWLRKREEFQKRQKHVFRTLMGTRTTPMHLKHIEAMNLVELEFYNQRKVMDCWQLYRNHLDDFTFNQRDLDSWDKERYKLLVEMLYEMSIALGYSYEKSYIQQGVYYPQGYVDVENQNADIRKFWLEVLRGERQLPMKAEVFTTQPPLPQSKQPAHKDADTDAPHAAK